MKHVLVVDDLSEFRTALKFLLSKPDVKVHEAGNGREALAIMQRHAVDVVITDCGMPVMSGLQLMEIAKKQYPRLPFIVVSSNIANTEPVRHLNPHAIIPKPPDLSQLDRAVREALSSPPLPQHIELTWFPPDIRPEVRGKFLFIGNEKFYIRGVTYGPFRPEEDGCEYHAPEVADRDFAHIAASGFNAVRIYTVPPRWLLDAAQRHGLRVMVGLPWEQHIAFLDDKKRVRDIERRVRQGVRACAGHPAVLSYAVGNEIPAGIVRWHGRRRIEAFIGRLCKTVQAEDPGALVTYVNFPSTEYLQLKDVDFISFNVYLEDQDRLRAYLARLQNLSADRPLVMAEIGLDSLRNGEQAQADALAQQMRTVFGAGCAGSFIFSWTDEWHRGGFDIEDWAFGLTDRDRGPKIALDAVSKTCWEMPFSIDITWPRISVAVCTYNGARTIRDTLEGLWRLDYPDFEIILVDDGSTDGVSDIARDYGVRLIRTENRGLSSARNTALEAASGDIIAYIDDDAFPDPHWLRYLALAFREGDYIAVGGPNLPPPGDGLIADCVARAPGGPVHVLLTDSEAEHIPGCNMAFRVQNLREIGGFDPKFRTAGDDVDVCWRLQAQGWKLGFSPAAQVWHHRRNSVRAYWKQQKGYGRAEAMLAQKWPDKYNRAGHLRWSGRIYGKGISIPLGRVQRVYHGTWGSALFQSLYEPASDPLKTLPVMPEWYLLVATLGGISALGILWNPLLWGLPFFAAALAAPILVALNSAGHAVSDTGYSRSRQLKCRLITTGLHLAQPLARLWGRLQFGQSPWRRRCAPAFALPFPRKLEQWSETWHSIESRLEAIETALRKSDAISKRGGDFDHWDLEVRSGLFGTARLQAMVEEHGGGKQLTRFRIWSRPSRLALLTTAALVLLCGLAISSAAHDIGLVFGGVALVLAVRTITDCASALVSCQNAIKNAFSSNETAYP